MRILPDTFTASASLSDDARVTRATLVVITESNTISSIAFAMVLVTDFSACLIKVIPQK